MIKLLVCDWDGTLCDSIEPIARCKRDLAQHYQLPEPDIHTVKAALGLPIKQAFAHCFKTATQDIRDAIQDDFHRTMLLPEYHATLFKEAKPFIASLREQQVFTTIATSKSRIELDHALQANQCTQLFDASCSGEEFQPKPAADMLTHLLQQFDCSPQQALMIGDSLCDIEMAHNAGMRSIAVTFGAGSSDALKNAEPEAVVHTWPELIHKVNTL